jgi:hypothetical protein
MRYQTVVQVRETQIPGARCPGHSGEAAGDAPSPRGGTWNQDGVIVFNPSGHLSGGLYRVSAAGGTPTRVTTPDASHGVNSHRWPMFLPDGKHFLYLAANVSGYAAAVIPGERTPGSCRIGTGDV